jgi:molybdopterin-containing oxidoreductase family iron-sulfur binding subunit
MVIDLDLCTGCGACVVACKIENNIPFTGTEDKHWGTEIEWMSIINYKGTNYLPIPCLHCDNPPCTKVCPVNATYINEEGIVMQIWDRCIGCRYCQVSCPYERKFFNWEKPNWPETYVQRLNPDVAPRPKGVVEKCTFCVHRLRKVKERARDEGTDIQDEEVQFLPTCAEACPARAIVFGDLSDPNSLVSRLAKSPRAFRLEEHLGTEPKVIYLAEEKRKGI